MSETKKYPYTVEPNIIKLAPNYYRILIKKGSGKNQQIFSEYVSGKIGDARAVKRKGFAELENQKAKEKDKGKITLFEFSKEWLQFCRDTGLSPTTINGYKTRLNNYILPELGGYPLEKINAYVIDKLFVELKNRDKQTPNSDGEIEKLSSSSLNGAYRVLRNLLNRAVIWDYIEYNPIHKVKCPSAKPRKEKETYNKEELFTTIKLLLDYNKKYGGMFIIDCCTGLRRCELNGLHIEKTRKHDKDIELDVEFVNKDGEKYIGGLVFARHSVVFDKELKKVVERDIPKTEKGKRGIPIPPICVEAIRECIKYREKEIQLLRNKYGKDLEIVPNLFLGKTGGLMHPDTLSHNWTKFRERNKGLLPNKNVTLYGLRHSFCTYMRTNPEITINEIMNLMGHTDEKTTDNYTHSNREIGDKIIGMWDGLEL